MGPWLHGGWSRSDGATLGPLSFDSKTAEFYRESIEFPFFEHHMNGAADPGLPEAFVFETGRDQWRRFDTWPPRPVARSIYLGEAGTLAFEAPKTDAQDAFDEYLSDPAKPVPYSEAVQVTMAGDYMTYDQRFASRRPDVVVYQTQPLEQDLTIAGPIEIDLVVSTTGTDSDFVVKVIDVFPDRNPPSPASGWRQPVEMGNPAGNQAN